VAVAVAVAVPASATETASVGVLIPVELSALALAVTLLARGFFAGTSLTSVATGSDTAGISGCSFVTFAPIYRWMDL
jgi:hypothetical protein